MKISARFSSRLVVVSLLTASLTVLAADPKPAPAPAATSEFPSMPQVQARSPMETIQVTELPAGYKLEVVLAEPDIKEPVMAAFDGDGGIFVVEMRTCMQDVDATGEQEPLSRVSLHRSSKGDGVYDQHTVFADKLLLPRILQPLDKGRVIIGETNTNDLYIHCDTDGDGVADKKELFYQGGPRGGNMEHQRNGPVWALDNWLYMTYNAYRLRWQPEGLALKEPTAPNGGQWGVGQDDWGKVWFVNAGGEKGPTNFQTGIVLAGSIRRISLRRASMWSGRWLAFPMCRAATGVFDRKTKRSITSPRRAGARFIVVTGCPRNCVATCSSANRWAGWCGTRR